MRRPATRTAAATFALGLLIIGPAAAATPDSAAAEAQVERAALVSTEDDHADHGDHDAGNQDVAEWPEWARTGGDHAAEDEHGHSHATEHTPGHGEDAGTHGDHGAPAGPAPERPRALVLGSFAAVNGAVLLAAAAMRRRTKSEVERRKSARAAALRDPGTSVHSRSSDRAH